MRSYGQHCHVCDHGVMSVCACAGVASTDLPPLPPPDPLQPPPEHASIARAQQPQRVKIVKPKPVSEATMRKEGCAVLRTKAGDRV